MMFALGVAVLAAVYSSDTPDWWVLLGLAAIAIGAHVGWVDE